MSFSITKPFWADLITQKFWSGESLFGYKQQDPVSKVPLVSSAGYGAPNRDPLNDKTILDSRPITFPRLEPIRIFEQAPAYTLIPPKQSDNSGFVFGSASGFH